jgi:flagellar FliL protein
MSDEAKVAEAAPASEPVKKKGGLGKKLIVLTVALVVVGGGAAWMLRGGSAATAAQEPGLESRGLLAFETLLVNLSDKGGNRFLKATVQLVLASKAEAAEVAESQVVMSAIRSSMLELMSQQIATELVTVEGKTALKQAIKERIAPHLKHQKVIDVLFSEFVVQF